MRAPRSAVACAVFVALCALAVPAAQAATSALTRMPYLTDATSASVRVSWATLSGGTANRITWGPAGGSCSQYAATGTGTAITVNGVAETQWTARLGHLAPNSRYCYQLTDGGAPVLAAPITFGTPAAPGDATAFSFDVIGDTGYNGLDGTSPEQDRLYASMARDGSAFVLTTGDMAYPNGSQTNYGDLISTGLNVSVEFGPAGWPVFGGSTPTYPVLGNHGRSTTFLQNWPALDAVANSGGTYAMLSYPGQAGASTATYPTAYYAFTVGNARFYVLDADWTDSNVGTSTLYGQDYFNHWAAGAAELAWLKADLAAHPGGLKFATFHFPMHSDNATEASDTYLQGSGNLEGILASAGVDVVFNGHAHMYERNVAAIGSMVSYVTGGGGGLLEPTGGKGCTAIDAYSIGWSPTKGTGTRCGAAPVPTSASQVFHYLHVTVSGSSVTVAPVNAAGNTFDVVTYSFAGGSVPATATLTPTADALVNHGATTTNYGSVTPLAASASSYRSLLRFDTSGIDPSTRTVTGATLRIYNTVGLSSGGVQVHPEADSWQEGTVTWANQPAWDPTVLAVSGPPVARRWLSIPLPASAVRAGGATDLGLDYSVSSAIARFSSREDPSNPPELLVTSTAGATPPPPPPPPGPTTTVVPTADTYVYQGAATQTYGSVTPLLSSASSYRTLLRFDTSWVGTSSTVSDVTLRLYATVGTSSGGVQVRPEAGTWSEDATNWSNQPAWSSQVLATAPTQTTAGWMSVSLPLTSINRTGSTDLGLSYSVSGLIERIASREDATHAPQLVVTVS
jgi:hypothetical protein